MSLTQEQIEKILSQLSKLKVKNKQALTGSINSIIEYMDILGEVDTDDVKPTVNVVQKTNILRQDVHTPSDISPEELLNCSNQKVIARQIALPNIMK